MTEKLPVEDLNPDFMTNEEKIQLNQLNPKSGDEFGEYRKSSKPYKVKNWGLMGEVKVPDMSTISKRRNVSLLGWITMILILLAFSMAIISFTVPGWGETTEQGRTADLFKGRYGVWYVCSRPLDGSSGREDCEPLNLVQKVPGSYT